MVNNKYTRSTQTTTAYQDTLALTPLLINAVIIPWAYSRPHPFRRP